jgi:hypothetical protein
MYFAISAYLHYSCEFESRSWQGQTIQWAKEKEDRQCNGQKTEGQTLQWAKAKEKSRHKNDQKKKRSKDKTMHKREKDRE